MSNELRKQTKNQHKEGDAGILKNRRLLQRKNWDFVSQTSIIEGSEGFYSEETKESNSGHLVQYDKNLTEKTDKKST